MSESNEPFWAGDKPTGEQPTLVYPPEHVPPDYHPPKTSRRKRWPWVACGVVLGVLLVPCLLISLLVGFSTVHVVQAGASLDQFCTDLTARHYDAAYDLLSSGLQAQVSHDSFVQVSRQQDETAGVVRSCQSPRNSISWHNDDVTLQFEIVRKLTYSGTVTLIRQSSGWKINRIDSELALLP